MYEKEGDTFFLEKLKKLTSVFAKIVEIVLKLSSSLLVSLRTDIIIR